MRSFSTWRRSPGVRPRKSQSAHALTEPHILLLYFAPKRKKEIRLGVDGQDLVRIIICLTVLQHHARVHQQTIVHALLISISFH